MALKFGRRFGRLAHMQQILLAPRLQYVSEGDYIGLAAMIGFAIGDSSPPCSSTNEYSWLNLFA
jgi:hypothetical protein